MTEKTVREMFLKEFKKEIKSIQKLNPYATDFETQNRKDVVKIFCSFENVDEYTVDERKIGIDNWNKAVELFEKLIVQLTTNYSGVVLDRHEHYFEMELR